MINEKVGYNSTYHGGKYLQQSGSSVETKCSGPSSGPGSHGSPFFRSSRVLAITLGFGFAGGGVFTGGFEVGFWRMATFGLTTVVTAVGRIGGLHMVLY